MLFYKSIPFKLLELKESGDRFEFSGYASTFGNLDHTGDVVMRGAFDETLASGRARKFLWQHDIREPIGVEQSLKVDEKGLLGTWKISQTTRGRDAYQLLKDGAVDSLSIGYVPVEAEYDDAGVRLLKAVDLLEVSLVSIPANDLAVVTRVKAFLEAEGLAALDGWGKAEAPVGAKPFPNEHACRLREPGRFQADSFRRMSRDHEGKRYDVIMGRLKGESTMTDQAFRYPKDVWTADAARAHCTSHRGIEFAAASGGKGSGDDQESKATWDAAYVNNLPDSAFAVILPGGSKDSDGKTTPRSLRKLPHHGSDGGVDLPHLRNALARLPQANMPDDMMARAKRHLNAHAKAEGVGDAGKADEHEHDFKLLDLLDADVPFDELLAQLGGLLTKGAEEAEALHARRLADERELSTVHLDAIKAFGANAEAMAQRLASLLPAPEPKAPSAGIDIRFELARRRLLRSRAVEHAS